MMKVKTLPLTIGDIRGSESREFSVALIVLVLATASIVAFTGAVSAQGEGNVAVEMQPEQSEVSVGDTIEIDVVVVDPDAGIGGTDFNVTTSNSEVVRFKDNDSGFVFENGGADNVLDDHETPAGLNEWIDVNNIYENGAEPEPQDEFVVGTLVLEATEGGTSEIEWKRSNEQASGTQVFDEDGYEYNVTTKNATVRVNELAPVGGFRNPPQDTNGDGLHDDVNGDGSFDLGDATAFYQNLDEDSVSKNPEIFNFNGEKNPDQVTLGDIIALYGSL